MRTKLKIFLIFTVIAVLFGGCNLFTRFDADVYVQSVLDAVYRGESAQYMQLTENAVLEDAAKAHKQNIEAEIDYFVTDYLGLASCSEQNLQTLRTFYGKVYRAVKYEITQTVKTEDGYTVDIAVSPIDLFEEAYDEMASYSEYFFSEKNLAANADRSEAEREDAFLTGILDILLPYAESIGYNDAETVTLSVVKNESGLYTIDRDSLQQFDRLLISYEY